MQSNFHPNALEGIAKGIQYGADAVAPTLGIGSNVIIEQKLYPSHIITNDANSIIQAIELEDPLEKRGLAFLKEGATATTEQSGDGRTTMVLLLNEILQQGIAALKEKKITPLQLKRELDECLPLIEKSLDEQTKQITVEDIPAVAAIAGENEELAQTLGAIYTSIGKEGIIHLEGSGSYDTSFSVINGVRLSGTGYLSPYMACDEEAKKDGRKETRALYHKPAILVTKNKISKIDDVDPLLQVLIAQGQKTLVIFADDMDSNVARMLIELQKNPARSINILIIKAPVLWKNYVFEDFAKITNSTIIEDSAGTSLGKKLQLDWLGTCETLIVDKDETTVIGIGDISEYLQSIKDDESLPKQDRDIRRTYLSTKTAILKLGAKSETELSYLRLKATDAVNSSRLALAGGIVAGGGVALLNCSKLPDSIGGKILVQALMRPMIQIMLNADSQLTIEDFKEVPTIGFHGFNAKTGKIEDLMEAGIVDAVSVTKSSIRNALGIASTILTASSVITLPPPSSEELANKAILRNVGF